MEAKDWPGKRALVTFDKRTSVYEVRFLEMSPSNKYIKLHYIDEDMNWLCVDTVHIVEFLPDVEG